MQGLRCIMMFSPTEMRPHFLAHPIQLNSFRFGAGGAGGIFGLSVSLALTAKVLKASAAWLAQSCNGLLRSWPLAAGSPH